MSMSKQLVTVQFHGDVLEAVEQDGKVWVSLRRCCENLGLDTKSQLRKLNSLSWACMVEMTLQPPGESQARGLTMIDTDSLLMWLVTVKEGKVRPAVKEKLVRYQREVKAVLSAHFMRREPPGDPAATAAMSGALGAMTHTLNMVVGRLAEMETTLATLRGRGGLPGPAHPGPHWTIETRLIELHPEWRTTPQQRAQVRYFAKKYVTLILQQTIDQFNRDLCFSGEQLYYLDKAIEVVRHKAEAEGKRDDWGLFRNAAKTPSTN